MTRLTLSTLCFILSACSALVDDVDDPGVVLLCDDDPCPTESHVACVVEAAAEHFPELRARDRLVVHWQETGDDRVYAYSPSEENCVVPSDALLWHELLHIAYWRADGDPDDEHLRDGWCPDLDPCAPVPECP